MRVHITLREDLLSDAQALREVVDRLVAKFSLTNMNERRLIRYGVLTADLRPELLEAVRQEPEVHETTPYGEKFASEEEGMVLAAEQRAAKDAEGILRTSDIDEVILYQPLMPPRRE